MNEPRRTPHGKWAAGAALILAALVLAVLFQPRPAPPRAPGEVFAEPAPLPVHEGRAGKVPCGYCDGDGRIDAKDLTRQAPRLESKEGPCPACGGKGGR
jgi:hypothetical protein